MVRREQELGCVRPRLVCCEPARVRVAMRTEDRQALDAGIKLPRDRADRRLKRKQTVGMELERLWHRLCVDVWFQVTGVREAHKSLRAASRPRRRDRASPDQR